MRANEFITENFWDTLAKGAADFMQGAGVISDKDHAAMTKVSDSKAVDTIADQFMHLWSPVVDNVKKQLKFQKMDPYQNKKQFKQMLGKPLEKLVRNTLKIDPREENYNEFLSVITTVVATDPDAFMDDADHRESLEELITASLAQKISPTDTDQTFKLRGALIQGTAGKEAFYVLGDNRKLIAYAKDDDGNYKLDKLNKNQERKVRNILKKHPDSMKSYNVRDIDDTTLDIADEI